MIFISMLLGFAAGLGTFAIALAFGADQTTALILDGIMAFFVTVVSVVLLDRP